MPSKRERKPKPRFLLNEADTAGRRIAPGVLSVAREMGPRLIAYAEGIVGDSAIAATCLEEAAASVSAAIEEKQRTGAAAVRNLEAYLFRTFIHLIDKAKQRGTALEQSLQEYGDANLVSSEDGREEARVLANEILAACDPISGRIVMLHLEGWSWDEIAEKFGLSRHAAETRYRKALDRARKTLKIRR